MKRWAASWVNRVNMRKSCSAGLWNKLQRKQLTSAGSQTPVWCISTTAESRSASHLRSIASCFCWSQFWHCCLFPCVPAGQENSLSCKWVFQMDSDPNYTGQLVQQWLKDNQAHILGRQSWSPRQWEFFFFFSVCNSRYIFYLPFLLPCERRFLFVKKRYGDLERS